MKSAEMKIVKMKMIKRRRVMIMMMIKRRVMMIDVDDKTCTFPIAVDFF